MCTCMHACMCVCVFQLDGSGQVVCVYCSLMVAAKVCTSMCFAF